MQEAITEGCGDRPFMVLFLGAGFAESSGLGLGNSIRNAAIRRLLGDDGTIDDSDLATRFYAYLEEHGQLLSHEQDPARRRQIIGELTLERVLTEEYRRRDHRDLPTLDHFSKQCERALSHRGPCVKALHTMFYSSRRLIVCTVNFDELIERGQDEKVEVFATEDQFLACPEYLRDYLVGTRNRVPILKLHGTITDISSCVATDEATLVGISEAKAESLRTLSKFGDQLRPWFYVGASMRDHDLRPVLTENGFAKNLQERWVLPYGQDTVDQFIAQNRDAFWRSQNAVGTEGRIVTETADTFLAAIATAWLS
jgi:hypothetical protein